ncbi:carbon starvation CstA family protein [Tichowtungia aerotolerans]|uniref:Carbon starvation protein A n=1 Tax=Tichowtungia aerotolerans TaxID=2697043 RepID=A0A6P1MDC0_9BACT|nr:carbon starvation protein A [Tichowtungia aerotolerans]QHI70564.1 carbon starvation protein A [Tichowtungia aerotolerans]
MNSLILAAGTAVLYVLAYNTYGRFLAKKLFQVNLNTPCPSKTHHDGVDFVKTDKLVLFGHHFTSIAGTGPIVGPAIAVIWGWVPALIWILVGSILMGAVHDFGSMIISLRNQGRSIGDIAGDVINARVRFLFLLIIFFALWLVVAIFGVVIAAVFNLFPESVAPVWLQIPIAIALGWFVYKKNANPVLFGAIAVLLMYGSMMLGSKLAFEIPELFGIKSMGVWVIGLLIYAYIASTLPVQILLQPRDYINAWQLAVAMIMLFAGIAVSHPAMVAPALNAAPEGAPPLMPILFITVACGAISGFHCLVSSGTTSKQCDNEGSAISIGYGGMLLEGLLAVFVLIACGAGIGLGLMKGDELLTGSAAFTHQYSSWAAAKGLGSKIGAFINGATNMISATGIPKEFILTVMGVFVASFAATTLDTATRIQRYIVSEIATACKVPFLAKRHPATFIAVATALLLAFSSGSDGQGALSLWPLFGAVNQLLAGLAFLVMTVWLAKTGRRIIYTLIPMIFMVAVTGWAMVYNLNTFFASGDWLLFGIGTAVVLLETWMVVEGAMVLIRLNKMRNT